jgi:hypothetical protein
VLTKTQGEVAEMMIVIKEDTEAANETKAIVAADEAAASKKAEECASSLLAIPCHLLISSSRHVIASLPPIVPPCRRHQVRRHCDGRAEGPR